MRSLHKTWVALIVITIVLISAVMMYEALAAAPPTLPGARLIRPTLEAVSGTTTFETDLAQSSPASDSTVAFTLYRIIDGVPEAGRFCFLSPTATNISGTTRWFIPNVDTRKITGNCSSSQTLSGTLKAPRDGTYRFGIWINGTEYLTPDSVTIQNGNAEDSGQEEEEPPPPPTNQNQNANTNSGSNSNTQGQANQNANSNVNVGATNENTNSAANNGNTNTATNGTGTNGTSTNGAIVNSAINGANTNTGTNTSNSANPQAEPDAPSITFVDPSEGAQLEGTTTIVASVSRAERDEIERVVGFVYSRGVWYTIGEADTSSGAIWRLNWDTTSLPNGTVYGLVRLYLTDGRVFATSQRMFTLSNAGAPTPVTNTNVPVTNGTANTNGAITNTNTQPPTATPPAPPKLDTDADGISDAAEIAQGIDPHRPEADSVRTRLLAPFPPFLPQNAPADTTDPALQILRVTGPGVTTNTEGQEVEEGTYLITGIGQAYDYMTLFIGNDEAPNIFPVVVDANGSWSQTIQYSFEPATYTAYVAELGETGNIVKKSSPFSFTVDAEQLEKDLGGGAGWIWIIVGIAAFLGITGGIWFWTVYRARGESGVT